MSTMKFCRECNNILYPKEDRENKVLLYACRNCDHQISGFKGSHSASLYRNVVDHAAGEFTQVLFEDVASDTTLTRTKSVGCAAEAATCAVLMASAAWPDRPIV
ncbi:hypothetical protein SETIT_5G194100v2 [Setaria italica]|uniref:DNA-directed RNA polymerase II subunit RPB9-like zinc ribbon domain-containing protein n=1 Tax=Setaria italica TaxID=4555 RepID=K3XT04_SETIT|nr:hypothetical protein SETIT_5G194100v2 [Setaria italica]